VCSLFLTGGGGNPNPAQVRFFAQDQSFFFFFSDLGTGSMFTPTFCFRSPRGAGDPFGGGPGVFVSKTGHGGVLVQEIALFFLPPLRGDKKFCTFPPITASQGFFHALALVCLLGRKKKGMHSASEAHTSGGLFVVFYERDGLSHFTPQNLFEGEQGLLFLRSGPGVHVRFWHHLTWGLLDLF